MAARPRWATGVCLALLAACGGEPATAPDTELPAALEAVVASDVPMPIEAVPLAPDHAVPQPDPPKIADPQAEADLASTEPVAERVV